MASIMASTCSAMLGPWTPLAFVAMTPRAIAASTAGVKARSRPALQNASQRTRLAAASMASGTSSATITSASLTASSVARSSAPRDRNVASTRPVRSTASRNAAASSEDSFRST